MPQIVIPIGTEVTQIEQDVIKIRIPKTMFWVIGEKNNKNLWDAYIVDPTTDRKEILRKDVTTRSFSMFSNTILKTPFPNQGKESQNLDIIKKFVKKITKNHGK